MFTTYIHYVREEEVKVLITKRKVEWAGRKIESQDGHCFVGVDDLSEWEISSKDGAEVGNEVGSLDGVVSSQVTRVRVASVGIRREYIQARFIDVGRRVVSGAMVGWGHGAESNEIQGVVHPVGDTGGETGVLGSNTDDIIVHVGDVNFSAVVEVSGSWKALGGVGRRALERLESGVHSATKRVGRHDIAEGNERVGKQGVLHAEGFVFAGMFDCASINFESFDYFAGDCGEVGGFGRSTKDINDQRAGSDVLVRIEKDKRAGVFGVGCDGGEGPVAIGVEDQVEWPDAAKSESIRDGSDSVRCRIDVFGLINVGRAGGTSGRRGEEVQGSGTSGGASGLGAVGGGQIEIFERIGGPGGKRNGAISVAKDLDTRAGRDEFSKVGLAGHFSIEDGSDGL